jgi:putative membrane protein
MNLNKRTIAKVLAALTLSAASIIMLPSCSSNSTSEKKDTKEVAMEKNEEKFDGDKAEEKVEEKLDDAKFLVKVSEINLEEIALGKLAQEKGMDQSVKDLGKMMENAHTKAQFELTGLAAKKNMSIPTENTQDVKDAYNDLSKKTGADFDKAFTDKMVSGHKNAIDKFEHAVESDCKDADVKAWASNTLPELRKHLEHAQATQEKVSKM